MLPLMDLYLEQVWLVSTVLLVSCADSLLMLMCLGSYLEQLDAKKTITNTSMAWA